MIRASRVQIATHHLKCWPEYFALVMSGEKRFEIRRNDRGFEAGDILNLEEYTSGRGYTGRSTTVRVTSILSDHEGLVRGFVIMGIEHL